MYGYAGGQEEGLCPDSLSVASPASETEKETHSLSHSLSPWISHRLVLSLARRGGRGTVYDYAGGQEEGLKTPTPLKTP